MTFPFQNTVGFFDPDHVLESVQATVSKYPDVLLAFHPEVATDRELYLSSPCRLVEKEKRLDMDHEIKSITLGGGANKGAYMEDLINNESAEEDDDGLTKADTPSKLGKKVKNSKELNEVNQLVYMELLQY